MTDEASFSNVKVVIRVRPLTNTYQASCKRPPFLIREGDNPMSEEPSESAFNKARCIKDIVNKQTLTLETVPDKFTFDYIAGEDTPQEALFEDVGRSIID